MKSFLGKFYRHLAIFSGHTVSKSHERKHNMSVQQLPAPIRSRIKACLRLISGRKILWTGRHQWKVICLKKTFRWDSICKTLTLAGKLLVFIFRLSSRVKCLTWKLCDNVFQSEDLNFVFRFTVFKRPRSFFAKIDCQKWWTKRRFSEVFLISVSH